MTTEVERSGTVLDIVIFFVITIGISLYGTIRAAWEKSRETQKIVDSHLVGTNTSLFWVSLSVCSTYVSAISILGFPAEVYFRGTMILYYLPMYLISFPICAYVFLPVFYELKMKSLYEYLERRFSIEVRLIATSIFAFQTLLYESAALYAPALALTSTLPMYNIIGIIVTASFSAIYLFVGGARAGIFTASLQMMIIFASLLLLCGMFLIHWDIFQLFKNASHGGRFIFDDFRLNPRIRHSAIPLLIGGTGNIISLYATNQLTVQRYLSLSNLKKAQKSIIVNIPMLWFILLSFAFLGTVIYGVYHGCEPGYLENELVTEFLKNKMDFIPGLQGIFLAALYSAGVSTLTASYNALTTIVIEDVIKVGLSRLDSPKTLNPKTELCIVKYLPICFAIIATISAYFISLFNTIILQIALSIFGAFGGVVMGAFCVGLFCPWIRFSASVVCGEICAFLLALIIIIGTFVNKVHYINLPNTTIGCNATVEMLDNIVLNITIGLLIKYVSRQREKIDDNETKNNRIEFISEDELILHDDPDQPSTSYQPTVTFKEEIKKGRKAKKKTSRKTKQRYRKRVNKLGIFEPWTMISEISYQYYSIIGLIVNLVVAHIVELILYIFDHEGKRPQAVEDRLLVKWMRTHRSSRNDSDAISGEKFEQSQRILTQNAGINQNNNNHNIDSFHLNEISTTKM